MPRLHHRLEIERAAEGAENEHGVPILAWSTLEFVDGLIQPLNVSEVADLAQRGPVASDLRIFLYPTDLTEADRIRHDGQTYQIDGIENAGGAGHHLELRAHLVS